MNRAVVGNAGLAFVALVMLLGFFTGAIRYRPTPASTEAELKWRHLAGASFLNVDPIKFGSDWNQALGYNDPANLDARGRPLSEQTRNEKRALDTP